MVARLKYIIRFQTSYRRQVEKFHTVKETCRDKKSFVASAIRILKLHYKFINCSVTFLHITQNNQLEFQAKKLITEYFKRIQDDKRDQLIFNAKMFIFA